MAYDSTYEAVYDLYDPSQAWDDLVTVGDRQSLNIGEEALGRHAGRTETALRLKDFRTGETEVYSFAELNQAANRVANYLLRRTEQGDRVAAMMPAQFELYAVVFGTLLTGRVYVPLAPIFGPDAVAYRLEDAGASVLFSSTEHIAVEEPPSTLDHLVVTDTVPDNADAAVESYDLVASHEEQPPEVDTHPDDPLVLAYTSGTTGQPKGLLGTQRGILEQHALTKYVVDLRADDSYFIAASPAWSYGLTMGAIVPGMVGAGIGSYRGPFDPDAFVETLDQFDVTNAMVPPTALRQLRNAGIDMQFDLRVLLSAGETLDEETVGWVERTLGTRPVDAYGLSEFGMAVSNYSFDDWEVKAGSMGRPMPGVTVRLLDDDEEPVEDGEIGEICIRRSETSDRGYWGKPDASLQTFTGQWLHTNDLARRDEDGYYWYVGRKDFVIVSAGYRIGPEEVEETVVKHDAVKDVAVTGVPDDTRGEIVKAYVVLREDSTPGPDMKDSIVEFTKTELSKHEYPRSIEFVDRLPRTATGKIDRSSL